MNNDIVNKISMEFYKERVKHGIGYVLKNSEKIVKNNCNYDLTNSQYQKCYDAALTKFKNKYEAKYIKDVEDKIFQSFEGYKGSYGLDYVLNNHQMIASKVDKDINTNKMLTASYQNALEKFKIKYIKNQNNNEVTTKRKRTIYGLSVFAFFCAILGGIMEAVNHNKK